jgi:hypothetical protein
MLPPFLHHKEHAGILGIVSQQFTFNMVNNLSRMISYVLPGTAVVPVISVVLSNQQLICTYITPPSTMVLPPMVTYPYYETLRIVSSAKSIPAVTDYSNISTTEMISPTINLQSIPNRVLIYAKRQGTDLFGTNAWQYCDSFAGIQGLKINWNNKAGILSTCDQNGLYAISRRNHLEMDYNQFRGFANLDFVGVAGPGNPIPRARMVGTSGSIVVLDPALDLGLRAESESDGLLGTFNLQVTVDVYNTEAAAVNMELFVVCIFEGSMTLSAGRCALQTGILTQQDVLAADQSPAVAYYDATSGGNMFSNIKDLFTKSAPYLRTAIDLASKGLAATGHGLSGGDSSNSAVSAGGMILGGAVEEGGKLVQKSRLARQSRR